MQLGEREDLSFAQSVKVKDSDSRLLSFVCNSSIAFVGADSLSGKRKEKRDGKSGIDAKSKSIKE